MALHIQMSEEAEKEYKRAKLRGMLSSFGAASALSLAFGLTLTFTVIHFAQDPPAEFLAYVPPAEDAPPRNQPTTPQLSTKTATPSNTVAPSVIVTTGAAPVAMAQIDIPMEDSQDDGLSLDIGIGMDAGLGELGEEGGGMGSSQASGSALEGVFFDLKQTKNGAPTKVVNAKGEIQMDELYAAVAPFYKTWNVQTLNRYYKSPAKVFASNFFVPVAKSTLAPDAFQCSKKVKQGAWIAVYRGSVKSPVTSRIRFVGNADNCIGVRFDGKMVLEAGYRAPSMYSKEAKSVYISGPDLSKHKERIKSGKDRVHKGYEFINYPGIELWNAEIGGLTAGSPVNVKEGKIYNIEIAVMDDSYYFGFVLFWEDMQNNPVLKDGKLSHSKKFYLFRTNFSMPDKEGLANMIGQHQPNKADLESLTGKKRTDDQVEWPEFDPDSPIWVAVP